MQLIYIIILFVINSGIISYDFFFFGLLDFSYTIHIILSSIIIFLIVKQSEIDVLRNAAIGRTLLFITLYLFIRFCYDFYSVGSAYRDYAIPTMLSQVLAYVFIYVLYIIKIEDYEIFIKKIQIVFFFLGILTITFYLMNPGEIKGEDLWSQDFGFTRFRHGFYPFSMVSLYICCIQIFVKNEKPYAFIITNIVVQLVSITLTNYRSSMIISFSLLLAALIIYLFKQKKYKYITIMTIIAITALYTVYNHNDNVSGAFARLIMTESLMEDRNMIWRLIESNMALDQMDSIKDYLIGVGFLKPFYLDDYMIFYLHNGYISVFYNYGIIAVLLFTGLILRLVKSIFNSGFKSMIGIISLMYFSGIMLQNFTSGIFTRGESAIIAFGLFLMVFDRSSRVKGDVCQTQADR